MKVKIKVGKVKAEGNCFKCGRYSLPLKIFGTDLLCPKCYEIAKN